MIYKINLNKAVFLKKGMPGPLWLLLRGLLRVKALCWNEAGNQKDPGRLGNKDTDFTHTVWAQLPAPASSYPFVP